MTLTQARQLMGRRVAYQAPHPGAPFEYGYITKVTERYVFVRFDGDGGAKACTPGSLQLDAPTTLGET